jgi:hypothetical protein
MLTEVAPGVFGVDHRVAAGKNGIVSGERAALAIDTGHYPDEGQAMVDFPGQRACESGWGGCS